MKRLLSLFTILLFTASVYAQQPAGFSKGSKFWVDGTSTLHDWTVESSEPVAQIWTSRSEAGKLPAIDSIQVKLQVTSLKSGKGGMDKKMYEALKSDKFNEIRFTGSTVRAKGNGYEVDGKLTIAGTTKTITLPVSAATVDGKWIFTGSTTFDMSSYNVTPPVALMGTIKTGDKVTVRFEVGAALTGNATNQGSL